MSDQFLHALTYLGLGVGGALTLTALELLLRALADRFAARQA